jgi:hypothetical protein
MIKTQKEKTKKVIIKKTTIIETPKISKKSSKKEVKEKDCGINAIVEKKKRGRKLSSSSPKMYFTEDTEKYIIKYNNETDDKIRNDIYETKIKPAFDKLAENILNTFKFTYFEVGHLDIQKDVVSFLVSNIHKFKENKGKAFSYFSIIAKNYLILLNNATYKKFKQNIDIDEHKETLLASDNSTGINSKSSKLCEFTKLMIDYWDQAIPFLFKKKKDVVIAHAVVELFRQIDRLENFNKKALYIYIREMTDCKTQHITKIINKMKNTQEDILRQYLNTGIVTFDKNKSDWFE